jgi:menaquinone-specific isochorismate synthase
MTLVARTRRLDRDVDLVAVAGPDGVLFERGRAGLAGRGEALRIAWPAGDAAAAAQSAAAVLAAIEADDEVGQPGCGPVAFGALPFVPGAGCELVVPSVIVGRAEDGTRWVTTVTDPDRADGLPAAAAASADEGPDALVATLVRPDEKAADSSVEAPARGPAAIWGRHAASPQRFTVEATMAPEDWCALVERATKVLASDPVLSKVVLAREVRVGADRPIDRVAVLQRLRAAYPGCHLLSVDGLVGASPELLVSRTGDTVRSHPLAGTAPRGGDPTTDQRLAASLLASTKDREEHQITIDMVHDTLVGWCSYLDYEAVPSILAVANVQHLATLVEGRLSRPTPSVLELVAALHPTPAVAGRPRTAAVDWIVANEGFDRSRYAGTVGWADGRGNGTWAVAVRCAEIDGPAARVFAGNGIVADSDPDAELAETQAKLQALLSAIVRP